LFEVTGRCENGSCIYGMSSDYNVTVYVLAMHLQPVLGQSVSRSLFNPLYSIIMERDCDVTNVADA